MKASAFKKLVYLALVVALLGGSNFAQKRLNGERGRLKLTRVQPLENAPPLLAFVTVALGGFRGLIANLLWVRATDLQQDEKFFEAVQLADWITKLQPHLTTVWVHQAWNMSYNISVKFPDNRDRWPWVRRAIELLRDDGLRYNPQEALIYRELAWIYQHKMGNNLDNAHVFYKMSWAGEMVEVLGSGNPNFDDLINPVTDEQKTRAKILRETYKLDPVKMKQVDEEYGPLEWRLPESHAIFWASLGLEKSKRKDLITLRRVVYQSLDLASKRGRLVENRADNIFEFGPNIKVIPKANKAYEEMLRDDPEFRDNIQNGHRNFLKNAIASLYTHNREAESRKYFEYAVKLYPYIIRKDQDLDSFVVEYITEDADTGGVDRTKGIIEGLLERSYYDLAIDEDDQAIGYERMAKKLWERHKEKVFRADRGRVDLPPYENIKGDILNRIITFQMAGWSPALVAQLCTRLGLPAPKLPETPPVVVAQTGPGIGAGIRTNGVATNQATTGAIATPKVDDTPLPVRNLKDGQAFLAKNKQQPGVVTLGSGLQYKVVKEGTGRTPSATDRVRVHYRGTLITGAEFDSSAKLGHPAEFAVNGVIKGWTEALLLMKEGTRWIVYVPPHLAYGERGGGPIEPNSTLVFDVELVEVVKK
jgi:FKBP-type peptidyl-prolyl cis-trans isomerase